MGGLLTVLQKHSRPTCRQTTVTETSDSVRHVADRLLLESQNFTNHERSHT